jgi:glycosyltransferase involved in cell wall biosynthesis
MRIGMIAPPWVAVPPRGYGGTEAVVDNLARGLQARGHEVRLFTVGESTCPVPRAFLYPNAVAPMGTTAAEAAHALAAYEALDDVDVIHDHTSVGPLLAPAAGARRAPIVITHHGAFTFEFRRIMAAIAHRASIVAISHNQADSAPEVPISAVIHHGIDLDMYRAGPGDGGYLLFVGRMSADKGIDRAIRVARASERRLVIATKVREPEERDFFDRVVRPLLGPDVEVWIEPALPARLEMFRHATALVNPITWPEPFGLVMAEALASGTPVLAFSWGAAPEIVDDGITGHLCIDEAEMVGKVDGLDRLDRRACRAAAEARFSLERMTGDYERVYRDALTRAARSGHTSSGEGLGPGEVPCPDLPTTLAV